VQVSRELFASPLNNGAFIDLLEQLTDMFLLQEGRVDRRGSDSISAQVKHFMERLPKSGTEDLPVYLGRHP
jgi:hypothetical protein